jgi:hypothetical protein
MCPSRALVLQAIHGIKIKLINKDFERELKYRLRAFKPIVTGQKLIIIQFDSTPSL